MASRLDAGQRGERTVNKTRTVYAAAAHAPGLGSGGVLRGRAVAEAGPREGLMHGRAKAGDPLAWARWDVDVLDDAWANQQRPDSAASLAHRMTQTHNARQERSAAQRWRLDQRERATMSLENE
jgi:hypothetical protein